MHSKPYRPQGRGKKERFFRTVAEQFAVEIDTTGVPTLAELNRWWAGWVEQVYHHRVHSGTAQTPLDQQADQTDPDGANAIQQVAQQRVPVLCGMLTVAGGWAV